MKESFGLWSKRKDIGDASTYVRKIRREWEKRPDCRIHKKSGGCLGCP